MTPELKLFIENNIDLVNACEFDILYKHLRETGLSDLTSEFSEIMLKAGIDPLLYMDYVPNRYLMACTHSIADYKIPPNIRTINFNAFTATDFVDLIIPEGVKALESRSFSACTELITVSLPNSIEFLANSVFSRSINLKRITYNGTYAEWEKVDKYDNWITAARVLDVEFICKDKKLWIH